MHFSPIFKSHRLGGMVALGVIVLFWTSTIVAELFLDVSAIVAVKTVIAWAVLPLCAVLAATAWSGTALAGSGRVADRPVSVKAKRTRLAAATGLVVLVPCAISLHMMAQAGSFGTVFAIVQAVELVVGLINIRLLALNARDGLQAGAGPRGGSQRLAAW